MPRHFPTLMAASAAVALLACAPPATDPAPQISTVRAVPISETFTVEDCNAYPGGAVIGQGSTAVCRIVP